MWLDNLKELRTEKGLSNKQLAAATNLPEKTISRIFSGDTDSPYVDTLHRIVKALGGSLDDILADTKVVVGSTNMTALNETLDAAATERDLLAAENAILKDKVSALTAQVAAMAATEELLTLQLKHKDELLAVHNYYIKRENNTKKDPWE